MGGETERRERLVIVVHALYGYAVPVRSALPRIWLATVSYIITTQKAMTTTGSSGTPFFIITL